MPDFDLDSFISELRNASRQPDAKAQVLALMTAAFHAPETIADRMFAFTEDETLLLKEEHITIWHWRAQPNVIVPPHDHQIPVVIGVYEGAEENRFHQPENGRLVQKASKQIGKGEVFSIDPESIHSVQVVGDSPCLAIHVYLGDLDASKRSLFDWETGEASDFSWEAYNKQVRFV